MDGQNKEYKVSFNSTPLVSVIVPTYNQASYIDETISSILKQTVSDFELIVVNDGSTDNTLEVLNKWLVQDDRVRVLDQENTRLPGALNTGLEHVRGVYVTWMSSDSCYEPDAFEVLLKGFEEFPKSGLISTHFRIFGSREEVIQHNIGTYTLSDMKKGNYVGCSFMFRKECADRVGLFDVALECVEDWDYWIRISQYWPLQKLYGVFAHWRDQSENMSNRLGRTLGEQNTFKLMKKCESYKQEY